MDEFFTGPVIHHSSFAHWLIVFRAALHSSFFIRSFFIRRARHSSFPIRHSSFIIRHSSYRRSAFGSCRHLRFVILTLHFVPVSIFDSSSVIRSLVTGLFVIPAILTFYLQLQSVQVRFQILSASSIRHSSFIIRHSSFPIRHS
jgi:hypothetical protein